MNTPTRLFFALIIPAIVLSMLGYSLRSIEQTLHQTTLSEFVDGLESFSRLRADISQGDNRYFFVDEVIDGDTIRVTRAGEVFRVRLLGIDTPETVDPRKPVECFGLEASAHASNLLLHQSVVLTSDPTQQDTDRYGRLIRYVHLKDGTSVNERMIRDGFAHEYTYAAPYEQQSAFVDAQEEAKRAGRGLWAPGACGE
jgi:micrococcal nuclease